MAGKKTILSFFVAHVRNIPQLSETRRVTQKTPLKNRSTLGIHSHDEVDRVKKVEYLLYLKVNLNKYTF